VQPGVVVPCEVITEFMLHLKITVEDHKSSVFVEMQKKYTEKTAAGGSHVARLNSSVGRETSKSMNAAKRLHYVDGDVPLDKAVNLVIKESEVFFAISRFYVTDVLFLSQKLLSLYPKYVRCLVADGCVLGCLQP
jgi:hypothetical protein